MNFATNNHESVGNFHNDLQPPTSKFLNKNGLYKVFRHLITFTIIIGRFNIVTHNMMGDFYFFAQKWR